MSNFFSSLARAVGLQTTDDVLINQFQTGGRYITKRIAANLVVPPTVVPFTINTQSGTNYNALKSDSLQVIIKMTNASNNTITVNPTASLGWAIGDFLFGLQYGLGFTSFLAGSGVTIRNSSSMRTRLQYSMICLQYIGPDEWVCLGDFA